MPTLADIKTRIATEMVRDDLLDDLAAQLLIHIQRACEFYSDERFWFNAIIDNTAATVAATDTVAVPSTVRRVDRVTIPASYQELREVQLDDIDPLSGSMSSIPYAYAYLNDTLKLYPIPDAVYALRITGLKQIDAPAVDADTSVWTNQAQDLIVGRAKYTLYRGQFRDEGGASLALAETTEALARLKRETARRLETPLRPNMAPRRRYNINSDY